MPAVVGGSRTGIRCIEGLTTDERGGAIANPKDAGKSEQHEVHCLSKRGPTASASSTPAGTLGCAGGRAWQAAMPKRCVAARASRQCA